MITVSQIRNGKILVVDDKQLNVDLMKRMLADGGYTSVDSTTNPDEVSLRTLEKKNAVCPIRETTFATLKCIQRLANRFPSRD